MYLKKGEKAWYKKKKFQNLSIDNTVSSITKVNSTTNDILNTKGDGFGMNCTTV